MKLSIDSRVAPANSNFNSSSQLRDSSILDGSEVHFKCDTEANPNDIRMKWFINDILVIGDYTNEMVRFFFPALFFDEVFIQRIRIYIWIVEFHV